MKYETMVKLHKLSDDFWGPFTWSDCFTPKLEYTIFDLIEYLPGAFGSAVGITFVTGLLWIYNHRKKWVIAKSTESKDDDNQCQNA